MGLGPRSEVTEALVVELLDQASGDAPAFTHKLLSMPILSTLATCSLSLAAIYQMLCSCLHVAVKDAQSGLLQPSNSNHKLPGKPSQGSQR